MAHFSPEGYKTPSTETELNDFGKDGFWESAGLNQDARFRELDANLTGASADAAKALQTANSYAGQIAQANTTAGSAVVIANDARDTVESIEGPISTRLGYLETREGLAPGDVYDAETASVLTQDGSLSQAALNAQIGDSVKVIDKGAAYPNVYLGGQRNGADISAATSGGVLLGPGSAGFYANIIGGDGTNSVGKQEVLNVVDDTLRCDGAMVGGIDNMVGQISDKLITAHSYSRPGPDAGGHNGIIGGAGHVIGENSGYSGIVAGSQATVDGIGNVVGGMYNAATGRGLLVVGQDNDVTADYATATGRSHEVTGIGAFAAGVANKVHGLHSTASGTQNTVEGAATTSFGSTNTSTGNSSFIAGQGHTTIGNYATAVGRNNTVDGPAGFAAGDANTATGRASVALGRSNHAEGEGSTTTGAFNTASGAYALAAGYGNTASGEWSVAVGNDAEATGRNEWTRGGSGWDGIPGSKQVREFVVSANTTGASPALSSAAGAPTFMPPDSVWMVTVELVAVDVSTGDVKAWTLTAATKRIGDGSGIRVSHNVEEVAADTGAAAWAAKLETGSIGHVRVHCTGEAGKTLRWAGNMRAVQIKLPGAA